MKIGIDAKRAFFNTTGLGQFSRTLIQDLEENISKELLLFSPKIPKEKPLFKSQVVYPKSRSFFWRSYGIKREIVQHNISIYHGLSNEVPLLAHGHFPCKFVLSIHDLIPLQYPEWYPFIDAKIYAAKMRYACKHADKVVAISEITRRDLLKLNLVKESKIDLIFQSLSRPYRNVPVFEKRKEKPYVLYVGSFSERKNLLFLLKVFAELAPKIPHQLLLIGDGKVSYKAKMQKLISKYGLEKRVEMLHKITNAELPKYYGQADLFLYPSRYEGFGLPVAEAIACGTPAISTAGTSMEEAGGKGAVYLPLNGVDWKYSILELLESREKSESLVALGKLHIHKFSPKEISQQWDSLYNSLS